MERGEKVQGGNTLLHKSHVKGVLKSLLLLLHDDGIASFDITLYELFVYFGY